MKKFLIFCGIALTCFCLWLAFFPCPDPLADLSYSKLILDRHGQVLRIGLSQDGKYRIRTSLDQIPPETVNAVIRYEDKFFWKHPGVNPAALIRAIFSMLSGQRRMGGSTITMQVARLSAGLKTGTVKDKLIQLCLALNLECHYSKARILEAYFNLAPYGGNIEGLGAAARIYFHKYPAQLLPSESLALMLVPQNPALRKPSAKNGALMLAFQRIRAEWLGEKESAPLKVFDTGKLPFACPHLCTELLATKDSQEQIKTSIDLRKQRILERSLTQFAQRGRSRKLQNAAAILVHWPSMEVRALVGSANFHNTKISGQIDGTLARRSPGSTLKPFIYALALNQGHIHPQSLLADIPQSFSGYNPENFDGTFRGPLSAAEALRLSRNVPALSLAAKLAHPRLYEFLQSADVHFDFSEEHYGLSLVLGGAEITMREMASLYCMLANHGVWHPLRFSSEQGQEESRQLLSPEAAFITLFMLGSEDPEARINTIPLRAKTGTSNGFRDAWTAGVFGPYVLIVWVGNFDNSPNPFLIGAQSALPLYKEICYALAGDERIHDSFAHPPANLNLQKIPVCRATGDVDTSLCTDQTEVWFIPGVSPIRPTGILRRILIDKETGLRACIPDDERTEERIWEFWPTNLQQQFLRAGIVKAPPPPYREDCPQAEGEKGKAPVIVSPKAGVIYHVRPTLEKTQSIALLAHAASGVKSLYWFADKAFLGMTKPGEVLLFQPEPKDCLIRVVDEAGRASTRKLRIEAVH